MKLTPLTWLASLAALGSVTRVDSNDCDGLSPGDFYFYYVIASEPDQLMIYPFEDVPGNLDLYLTDNAWTGETFLNNEGTVKLTTPADGIGQTEFFGRGPNAPRNDDWELVEGAFALQEAGDQIFLYCVGSTSIQPLAAISYNGAFLEAGLDNYGLNESALPDHLATNGTIVLEPGCTEWEYKVPSTAMYKGELKEDMRNPENWKSADCKSGAMSVVLPLTKLVAGGFLLVWMNM